jgi:hypothetical protein
LWDSVFNPSKYFQFKVRNSTEPGSFREGTSAVSYINVSNYTNFIHAITEFNNSDITDSVFIDFLIEVPPVEPPGNKESYVTFLATLAE